MALKSTVFKASLQIADMDRHYYHEHALTIARHPSETDERMMMRVLAFALYAHPALTFAGGLSTDDEPDLWQKDLTGAIEVWLEVGQPDEKRIRQACGRSARVVVITYSGRGADIWWGQVAGKLERLKNLTVYSVDPDCSNALAALTTRTMQLQCNIQDGQIWLGNTEGQVEVTLQVRQKPAGT